MSELFARKDLEGNYQDLYNHLNNVSLIAKNFSKTENLSRLSGLLHDLGKTAFKFQNYLINGGEKGSVIHSLQGAFFTAEINCDNSYSAKLLKEILEIAIISHHSGISDGLSLDGENNFFEKLNRRADPDLSFNEIKSKITFLSQDFENEVNYLFKKASEEITLFLSYIKNNYNSKESAHFALGLFTKYIYSCLIDADRLDAYLFDIKEKYRPEICDWDILIGIFEGNISKLGQNNEISNIRNLISDKCKNAADRETGIYQLSVPTGGGKTFSSLRFALHHAKKCGKKRIIYVIPYLSIIEQTAQKFKEILNLDDNSNILLEHHSNIISPDDDEERSLRKLATSRWDNPIIITTMVQFLETVMSSKASKLRKFHNMEDSVIIFDEIQSLPVNSINLFNEVISFLSKFLNVTVLLCTATQPLLDQTQRKNLLLSKNSSLIEKTDNFEKLKRTKIIFEQEKNLIELSLFSSEKAVENDNCLIIVNTKKQAKDLFYALQTEVSKNIKIFHLSTLMCSAHRFSILEELREGLNKKEKIICVSTPLIEAGVDISFSCVIRAMAGLDSITQAAGRCNRNGEYQNTKNVYVVPIKTENLDKLPDIKIGKEITARLLYENKQADFFSSDILKKYYHYYFSNRKEIMDFPVKINGIDSSVYALLSDNRVGKTNYFNRTGKNYDFVIAQAFSSADEKFNVIANNTESVIVNYGESKELLNLFKNTYSLKEKIRLIRKLEKFSVALFRDVEFKILYDKGAIEILDEEFGIKVLNENYYSETGVITEIDIQKLIL